jgi:hypothetical protein
LKFDKHSRQGQKHTKRAWNKFGTILKHFEKFQMVSNGINLIPFETISTTQNHPKYHWDAAKLPPQGILRVIEIVANGIDTI